MTWVYSVVWNQSLTLLFIMKNRVRGWWNFWSRIKLPSIINIGGNKSCVFQLYWWFDTNQLYVRMVVYWQSFIPEGKSFGVPHFDWYILTKNISPLFLKIYSFLEIKFNWWMMQPNRKYTTDWVTILPQYNL